MASVNNNSHTDALESEKLGDGADYHLLFSSPEEDSIILQSSDNVFYRIHAYTLRNTSGFFRAMFSLPQPSQKLEPWDLSNCGTGPGSSVISVHESSDVLTVILLMLSGLALLQPLSSLSFDMLERILTLAEIWDTPGPIAAIRNVLMSPHFLEKEPLRVYALASHFGWQEERRLASSYSLVTDPFDKDAPPDREMSTSDILHRLASEDLVALLKLRRNRRDRFKELLDSQERFSAGNTDGFQCTYCGVTRLDHTTWRALKQALSLEMDRRPLGDTIIGREISGIGDSRELGLMGWPEAERCWDAKCPKDGCRGPNYDRINTLKQLKRCIDELPLYVDYQKV